jgi:hypothetical protein
MTPYPYERVRHFLEDVATTIGHFPKLSKLTEISPDVYLWELAPIGSRIAKISHEVSFASRFTVELDKGLVKWKPVDGHGNASMEGRWKLEPRGKQTHMTMWVRGELYDIPVPLMFRPVAPPFIQGIFAALIERFLQKLEKSLDTPEKKLKAASGR